MDFNDFTQWPMGLLGALVAVFIFGVFIGTWWWYGMRAMAARVAVTERPAPARRRLVARTAP